MERWCLNTGRGAVIDSFFGIDSAMCMSIVVSSHQIL